MACKSHLLLLALILMSAFASARRPPVVVNHEAFVQLDSRTQGLRDEKTDVHGNGKLKTDSTRPDAVSAIGLIPVIPGGDGSFHFDLGPIGVGGNIGWGSFAPGYGVPPYSRPQPYVVVSPYTSPYSTSSPYQPPVPAYGQPSQGYYSPVSGYGQPSQGYYSPVSGYGQPAPVWGYGQPPLGYSGPYSSVHGNNASPMQYGQPSQGSSGPHASAQVNAPTASQVGG